MDKTKPDVLRFDRAGGQFVELFHWDVNPNSPVFFLNVEVASGWERSDMDISRAEAVRMRDFLNEILERSGDFDWEYDRNLADGGLVIQEKRDGTE